MRKRTSPIWTESREDFQNRVKSCNSIADIVRSFGFVVGAAMYKIVYARIQEDDIDISHIPRGIDSNKGRIFDTTRRHASEYLVIGSVISSYDLKKKLIRDGVLNNECTKCGLKDTWCGEPINLQLDHINGVRDDNRLENLRILCPNCHSQTATFSGKHKARKYLCESCGQTRSRSTKSTRCQSCANRESSKNNVHFYQPRRFDPTKEELEKLVWEKPTTQIAKDFGVSDVAVSKRCKRLGISKPPRGHWMKSSETKGYDVITS